MCLNTPDELVMNSPGSCLWVKVRYPDELAGQHRATTTKSAGRRAALLMCLCLDCFSGLLAGITLMS